MDQHDAALIFGSANIEKLEQFKLLGGNSDFGDHAHLFGAPSGSAIICWSIDGRVAVRGILFSESPGHTATVEIQCRRIDGATSTRRRRVSTDNSALVPASKVVERVSPQGNFNEVRVRLFSFTGLPGLVPIPPNPGQPDDPDGSEVAAKLFKR